MFWLSNLHIGYWTSLSCYNVLITLPSSAQGFCSSTGWLAAVDGKLALAVLLEKQRALKPEAPWDQCHGSTLPVHSPPPTLSAPVLGRTKLTQPRQGQKPSKVWSGKALVVEKGFGVCLRGTRDKDFSHVVLQCGFKTDSIPFQVFHLQKM